MRTIYIDDLVDECVDFTHESRQVDHQKVFETQLFLAMAYHLFGEGKDEVGAVTIVKGNKSLDEHLERIKHSRRYKQRTPEDNDRHAQDVLTMIAEMAERGVINHQEIADELNRRGVRTISTIKKWRASLVLRIINRATNQPARRTYRIPQGDWT